MRPPYTEAEKIILEAKDNEARIRSAYDTLFGYLQSVPDVYARAHLVRDLDYLYERSLDTLPESDGQLAETADIKTSMSATKPDSASTAPSHSLSGDTTG